MSKENVSEVMDSGRREASKLDNMEIDNYHDLTFMPQHRNRQFKIIFALTLNFTI